MEAFYLRGSAATAKEKGGSILTEAPILIPTGGRCASLDAYDA